MLLSIGLEHFEIPIEIFENQNMHADMAVCIKYILQFSWNDKIYLSRPLNRKFDKYLI